MPTDISELLLDLHEQVESVCPHEGVYIGDNTNLNDRSTWGFHIKAGATPQQIAAAQALIQSFVFIPKKTLTPYEFVRGLVAQNKIGAYKVRLDLLENNNPTLYALLMRKIYGDQEISSRDVAIRALLNSINVDINLLFGA